MKKGSAKDVSPRFGAGADTGATRTERKEIGKALRKKASLESHAELHIRKTGRDVIEVLEKSNIGRIPELVPVRYGRMLVSPFTFYRGSAALMALDLALTPASGCIVQACGDCHIQNFGAFATPERKLVVDINDFDETLPAPWEWDVKRLAASLVLAAMSNGFSLEVGQEAALTMVKGYREYMSELSEKTLLEIWYSHIEHQAILELGTIDTRKRQQKLLKEALQKSSPEVMAEKLTTKTNGKLRFREMPPLLCHVDDLSTGEQEQLAFDAYRKTLPEDRRVLLDKFQMVDIARKIVGIGSVGTKCGVVLLASSEDDMLILQIKEARESVLEPYAGKSKYEHHGQRIVNGQKLMQAASDMFLGWTTGPRKPNRHFFIRQLKDVKIGVNTALWSKSEFTIFPKLAGEILARAHARSSDAPLLRGYMGKNDTFDEAIVAYATEYAELTERDYHQFVKACKSGRLTAEIID